MGLVEQFVNFSPRKPVQTTSAEDEELVQRSLIGHFSDELPCGVSTALRRLLIRRQRGTSQSPLLFLVTIPDMVSTPAVTLQHPAQAASSVNPTRPSVLALQLDCR